MLIDYYKQLNPKNLEASESPVYFSHKFKLSLLTSSLSDDDGSPEVYYIDGILNQIPALHYTTKWGNSPAAKVTDVIKKVTEHKYLKAFAENSPDYRPPIVTDGWTQQVPQSAEPLSFDLEFRAYPQTVFNTTSYFDIIKFLIFATTPKKYSISHSINYINNAAEQAFKKGEDLADIFNNLSHEFDSNTEYSKSAAIKVALAAMAESNDDKIQSDLVNTELNNENEQALAHTIIKTLNLLNSISNMHEIGSGGCPLLLIDIPGLSNGFDDNLPWIITSWSFKPAVNTTVELDPSVYNREKQEFPIYMDFKITLETQYAPTSQELNVGKKIDV